MSNVVDKVKELIESKWVITNETSNRIYFKYEDMRGAPKFYFNKKTNEVIRVDHLTESSKDAISVEVMTHIYNIIDESVKPVDALYVVSNRHTDYVKMLLDKYSGRSVQVGGEKN